MRDDDWTDDDAEEEVRVLKMKESDAKLAKARILRLAKEAKNGRKIVVKHAINKT